MKLEIGPIIVTPWVSSADGSHAIGCPLCREWSEVPPDSVGKAIPCPRCGGALRLNPFTIKADWRPIAKAWSGEGPATAGATIRTGRATATQRNNLRDWRRFIQADSHIVRGHPEVLFQQAANQPDSTTVAVMAHRWLDGGLEKRPWVRWINKPQARSPCLMTLIAHTGEVFACAFSPDGRRVVSASADKTLKVWDCESARELATLTGHTRSVTTAAYSPDGRRVVSGSSANDSTMRIWDVDTGEHVRTIRSGHTFEVTSCAYSPDGRRILSSCAFLASVVWNSDTGKKLRTLSRTRRSASARESVFSPDGALIATAGTDGTVKLWDATTGALKKVLTGHGEAVYACAFSPDCSRLVSASGDSTLIVWDILEGNEIARLAGHTYGRVLDCAFSPSGDRVLSCSDDMTLKIWDAATGGELGTLSGHSRAVHSCAFSPHGERVVSASADGTLKIWDAATKGIEVKRYHRKAVVACAFSPDGRRLVSSSEDSTHRIIEVTEGRMLGCLSVQSVYGDTRLCGVYSPDGRRIISYGSFDDVIRIWDAQAFELLLTIGGHWGTRG